MIMAFGACLQYIACPVIDRKFGVITLRVFEVRLIICLAIGSDGLTTIVKK